MSIKVYVVTELSLIDFIVDNDIDCFKAYLSESKENEEFFLFEKPECFDTEAESLAFSGGIGYGFYEHATPERFPLRSCDKNDLPFIEAIENY